MDKEFYLLQLESCVLAQFMFICVVVLSKILKVDRLCPVIDFIESIVVLFTISLGL
jgi:hypothetical protein